MEYINILFKFVLFIWLLLCSLEDLKRQEINIVLIGLGSGLLFLISIFLGELNFWDRFAGFVLGLIIIILHKVTREQIGLGDGLILCATGIALGFNTNVAILINSLLFSAVFSLIYIIIKKANKKTTIPFVPFVLLASLGVIFSE